MKFGEKLREQRNKAGLSQEELGKYVGITKRTIINYENGNSYPQDRKVYFKLAEYFDVDVNYFLTENEEFLTLAAEGYGKRGQEQANHILEQRNALPQGTLAERIRAGGAGLGGFLTPTGVGTIVAAGKEIINVDGRDYFLEKPLKADFALLRGNVTDKFGNTTYNGTTRNFNPMMATAAKHVIMGACEIVEIGGIDPNNVVTSGIFVDSIVGGEKPWRI